jgi:hypothetical protein
MLRIFASSLLWLIVASISVGLATSLPAADSAPTKSAPPGTQSFYERDVRPILKLHCFGCHGEGGKREGELDLRLQRLIIQGGDSGPAVVPG